MPQPSKQPLEPRKLPIQARSAVTVDSILEAVIQVLLEVGKERLNTTIVARRAGVSVGTLYQYFPNKSALLQAVLKHHLTHVAKAVESACQQQKGQPLHQMAASLVTAFLQAKMRHPKTSAALYAISGDLDGARIAQQMGTRATKAVAAMLETSPVQLTTDPQTIASMLYGVMAGVSRGILESASPEKQAERLRQELITLACAYLNTCSATPSPPQER